MKNIKAATQTDERTAAKSHVADALKAIEQLLILDNSATVLTTQERTELFKAGATLRTVMIS